MARRSGLGPLLLAGLAAFGYYKYSKMSEQEKRNMKDKAKRAYEENVPENVRNMISGKGNKQTTAHQNNGTENTYSGTTGNTYTGGTGGSTYTGGTAGTTGDPYTQL